MSEILKFRKCTENKKKRTIIINLRIEKEKKRGKKYTLVILKINVVLKRCSVVRQSTCKTTHYNYTGFTRAKKQVLLLYRSFSL